VYGFNDLLARRETLLENVAAQALTNSFDEGVYHAKFDVSFEQRRANILEGSVEISVT
jgi:hypothetical protein